jgi:deoxyribonuclease-4
MFGSHLSIAGGLHQALLAAAELNLQTVQIFTRNQRRWDAPPLKNPEVCRFRAEADRLGITRIVAHDSYLVNLAAGDEQLRQKSIAAFTGELQRCSQLGISFLVTHGGSHGGAGEARGIRRLIDSLNEALAAAADKRVIVCLETTAGQGAALGWRFEHLADIIAGVRDPERLGVCLDTCHVLAAGYDITTEQGIRRTISEFDRIIGLNRLRVIHVNDSLKPLGSRVDRHAHIGLGHVGLPAFAYLCRDARFLPIPKILETPKETAPDGRPWDQINLSILRALAAGKAAPFAGSGRRSEAGVPPHRAAGRRPRAVGGRAAKAAQRRIKGRP